MIIHKNCESRKQKGNYKFEINIEIIRVIGHAKEQSSLESLVNSELMTLNCLMRRKLT